MTQTTKKWLMLVTALSFHISGYLMMNALVAWRGVAYTVALPIDYQIPFIKYFVPIYSVVYFVPVITFFLCWKSYEVIVAAFKAFMWAGVVCFFFFILFPVEFTLRASLTPPYDFFDNFVRFFYWLDRPYNCFPSLHAALAFISVQVIERHRPRMAPFFYGYAFLVSASTLFIRQHYILDLVSGAALAYILGWWLIPKELGEKDLFAEEIPF